VPTVTFAATAFAVRYLSATPFFLDVDESWNMDPGLIAPAARLAESQGRRVAAAIPVDLSGTPANLTDIAAECDRLGISIVEDAAEALGARTRDRSVGSSGFPAAFLFNGNKIMTTSGGGMLVSDDLERLDRVRYWACQARESVPWYEHEDVGYNHRLSNILAALGRSQLQRLPAEVTRRRLIRAHYAACLGSVPGVQIQSDPEWAQSNAWLTIVTFDSSKYSDGVMRTMSHLERNGIESRPTWKPMHQQPVFASCPTMLTGRGDRLFAEGLCLPSGSDVTLEVAGRISHLVEACLA